MYDTHSDITGLRKRVVCCWRLSRGVKNYAYVSSGGMYKDSDEVRLINDTPPSVHTTCHDDFCMEALAVRANACVSSQVPFTESSDVKESGQRLVEKHLAELGLPWTSFR